jgi:predicted MFS family arabinose efflux permease
MSAQISARKFGLAGGVCTLLGIGLARFAYTPLIPALVDAGWFSTHAADYLGAMNLLGYLIGAALAHRATLRFGTRTTLMICLIMTVASFYGCALDWGVAWYGFWRLICGVTGAALVVIGAPAALARIAPHERAGTSALVFSGIGLGIMASGTLVPWLVHQGIAITWLAMALLASAIAAWSWLAVWRHLAPLPNVRTGLRGSAGLPVLAITLVIIAYGLDAVGFVPHTLFWVDYIARELGRGIQQGSIYWILFGAGATIGPLVGGMLASRMGFRAELALVLGIKACAVALPLLASSPAVLGISSVVVGMMVPAAVTLTSGAMASLSTPARMQQLWGWATLSFALAQAVAAYGMTWGYQQMGTYLPLFGISAGALVVGTVAALIASLSRVD